MAEETPEYKVVASEFKEFSEKMRDPLVVGALLNKLSEERRSTNLLLKEIHERLDKIESRLHATESKGSPKEARPEKVLLSEVDERLVAFVKTKGRVSAEVVQKEFGYKNRNAASARLNALYKQGLLDKKLAGRTALFECITLTVPQNESAQNPHQGDLTQNTSFDK